MKLSNLYRLYKLSKNWEIINGKVSIPDYDLEKLDIRVKETDPNPVGVFMPAMTEEDFTKWQQQKSGWQKFYDKVLNKNDI